MGFSILTLALIRDHLPDAEWAPLVSSFGYAAGFLIVKPGQPARLRRAARVLPRAGPLPPRGATPVPRETVADLARRLCLPAPAPRTWSSRSASRSARGTRQRAEIRTLFAFREATVADAEARADWLREHAVAGTRDVDRLADLLEERCRTIAALPPTPERTQRIVRAAIRAHEDRFATTIHARLPSEARERLDALLRPVRTVPSGDAEAACEPVAGAHSLLNFVRGDPGRASVGSVKRELERLGVIRAIALPDGLFDDALPHEVDLCRRRVAVQPPSDLRRLPEATRLTWLAAYVHLRGRALVDGLVELLIETVHAIGARAERRVERQVIAELKKVTGKTGLLFAIANAALARPDGTVREVVFPVVGERTLRDLVHEWQSGPMYKRSLRTTIRGSYTRHWRRMVPALLKALDFSSNNVRHRPVIEALDVIRRHAASRRQHLPDDEPIPIEGVVRPLWRDAVLDRDAKGQARVNRLTYEICVLETLRERLRSKEVWVAGANRYRNPDEDLPATFAEHRAAHYAALDLPLDAAAFVAVLQDEMRRALGTLDAGLKRNPHVTITTKDGGWIRLSPLAARPDPENVAALKAEITAGWPMTSLLDIVKEADLRLGFTDTLSSPTAYETLDRAALRPRLLLCLNGLGTNAGLRRMDASREGGPSHRDLVYARRRYITVDRLREAIAVVTNGTLRARDPRIWGAGTTACASDSKHFGAFDQNLTTQWHVRYGGRGIMIYWHVEKNSVCIHSQLKSPSSSEAAAMIEGVLRHCTEMAVDRQYVDTSSAPPWTERGRVRPSSRLLGFQLLPRIKRIQKQRLYRPEAGRADAWPSLRHALTRPIDWALIAR